VGHAAPLCVLCEQRRERVGVAAIERLRSLPKLLDHHDEYYLRGGTCRVRGALRGRIRSAGRAEPTSSGTTLEHQPIFFPPDAADRGPEREEIDVNLEQLR
jgi:hypothetical protein